MRPGNDVRVAKAELRRRAAGRRADHVKALGRHGMARAAASLCGHVERSIAIGEHSLSAAYWPLPAEFDSRPLLNTLHEAGHMVSLPVVAGAREPLQFRRWQPGLALVRDRYDVMIPPARMASSEPSLIFVPLLAFDAAGYRLGYGGGYYDLSLGARRRAGLRICAVGLAFQMQIVDQVPVSAYDEPLDWIVTEAGAVRVGREKQV